KGKQEEYGDLLPAFKTYYKQLEPYALAREYFMETVLRNGELLRFAFQTYQLKNSYAQRGEQAFNDRKENLLNSFKSQYRNYSSQVDKDVFEVLIALYAKEVPSQF